MRARARRAGVVAGGALAASLMTVTTAAAAGPPMPEFRGRGLVHVFSTLDYRTRVDVHDVSGYRRTVLWPLNWKVCSQSPAAGRQLNGQAVTIGVVKKAEKCPAG
ncbi:hypothetical protein [Streptomyces sp. NRRL S-920]|uniref:hypothetical protein n=1 Tax=Streptomyces sp. NRRL S-920 TaxID=1463921 RepID=UPI0004C97E74|nr:hypothetical protein [Streptomyces sp. NRRL S-920]